MPLIKAIVSVEVDEITKQALALELSKITADIIGKPESYVAAVVENGAAITFGGKVVDGAFVEVKSIGGLDRTVNGNLCSAICEILKEGLGIETANVYVNFTDVPATNWGYNGSTFG
jgi:phenylpyruvate tautomerase